MRSNRVRKCVWGFIGVITLVAAFQLSGAEEDALSAQLWIPGNWQLKYPMTGGTEEIEGKQCLYLSDNKEGKINPLWILRNIQDLEDGKEYDVNFSFMTEKFNEACRVYIEWRNEKGKFTCYNAGETYKGRGDSTWQQRTFSFRFKNHEGSNPYLVLGLIGKGKIWFKDISINVKKKIEDSSSIKLQEKIDKLVKTLPEPRKIRQPVTIDPATGNIEIGGRAFFPIGVWYPNLTEECFREMKNSGVNLISHPSMAVSWRKNYPVLRYIMDKAYENDMMVEIYLHRDIDLNKNSDEKIKLLTEKVAELKDHPALLVWQSQDEPSWLNVPSGGLKAGYKLLKKLDPEHPVWMNFAPRGTVDDLKPYDECADILSTDIYPVTEKANHSDLENKTVSCVGEYVDKTRRVSGGKKPVWMNLQGFAWDDFRKKRGDCRNERAPTYEELRFMAYQSIVHGTKGILWWGAGHSINTRVWKDMLKVCAEMKKLIPVFLAETKNKAKCKTKGIEFIEKNCGGKAYIIAVNTSPDEVEAEFTGIGKEDAFRVLFENRKPETENNALKDSFKPYDVHIYSDSDKLPAEISYPKIALNEKQNALGKVKQKEKIAAENRENIATLKKGAKAIASSTHRGWKPEYTINEKDDKGWNDATHCKYPDWLEIDFPEKYLIDKVVIDAPVKRVFESSTPEGIRDFQIQSDKNGKWEKTFEKSGSDTDTVVCSFPPVNTDKIRIWITKTNADNDYSRIKSVKVYGKK